MQPWARSVAVSFAMVGVSALALDTAVQPIPTSNTEIQLTAQSQPLPEPADYFSDLLAPQSDLPAPQSDPLAPLADLLAQPQQQEVGVAANSTAAFPTPPVVGPFPATDSIGEAIKAIYDAVEPWVAYGFELFEWAAGWVVGVLAQQIGIFYDFWESITQSIVFNFADFLDGQVTFLQGLANIGNDTWNAIVQLGANEVNWFRSLLPPLPPLPFAAQQQQTTAVPADGTQEPDSTVSARATTTAAELANETASQSSDADASSPSSEQPPAEPTDPEAADSESADAEASDAEASDAEASDAEASDAEAADAEASDAEASDAEPSDTEASDTETSDAGTTGTDATDADTVDAELTDTETTSDATSQLSDTETALESDEVTSTEAVVGAADTETKTIVRAQGQVRGGVADSADDAGTADDGEPKALRSGAADATGKSAAVTRDSGRQLAEAAENVSDDLRSATPSQGSDLDSVSAG